RGARPSTTSQVPSSCLPSALARPPERAGTASARVKTTAQVNRMRMVAVLQRGEDRLPTEAATPPVKGKSCAGKCVARGACRVARERQQSTGLFHAPRGTRHAQRQTTQSLHGLDSDAAGTPGQCGGAMAPKILIVDDEPDLELLIRQRFRRQIREGAYQFAFARNGQEALDLIHTAGDIDLVLSDINMPV